jgi:hypothetical protein
MDFAFPNFPSVDPLAEKYYSISPYVYLANNPLKYIDPTGKTLEDPPSVKQALFAIRNPRKAYKIGSYRAGSNNISTYAGNFGINLTKAMGQTVVGEGNYNNAIRHVTWQAIITKDFDKQTAIAVGNAHEKNVRWTDFDKRSFSAMEPADKLVDLLNNMIGREIGEANPNATNVDLAGKIIDEFANNGLWTVVRKGEDHYVIQKTKLTPEEYQKAKDRLSELGNNGLTKINEDEANR